jgi:hypothetical protein
MRNFVLGVIAGMAIAVCGYGPYQIEAEYRHNVVTGLGEPSFPRHCTITLFKHDLTLEGTPVELSDGTGH